MIRTEYETSDEDLIHLMGLCADTKVQKMKACRKFSLPQAFSQNTDAELSHNSINIRLKYFFILLADRDIDIAIKNNAVPIY